MPSVVLAFSALATLVEPAVAEAVEPGGRGAPRTEASPPLVVRATAVDVVDLRRELGRRWPELVILDADGFVEVEGETFVYVEVLGEVVGETPISVTLIVSDGRAYVRQVTPGEHRARSAALIVGNLLEAILAEDLPPDFEAEIPIQRAPVRPTITRVPPTPAPVQPPRVSAERPARDDAPAARWRIAGLAQAQLVIGLVPTRRGTPTFGGGVTVLARAPRGFSFGVAARWATAEAASYRLLRTRLAVLGGWTGHSGELEWSAHAGPLVEPFTVSRRGARSDVAGLSGQPVLFGAAAVASVGYRVALRGRQPTSLRFGLQLELASSVLGSGAVAQVFLREPDGNRPLFGAGGLEASLAGELAVWFDMGRRSARRRTLRTSI